MCSSRLFVEEVETDDQTQQGDNDSQLAVTLGLSLGVLLLLLEDDWGGVGVDGTDTFALQQLEGVVGVANVEEVLGGISTGLLVDDLVTTWVLVEELGNIVDLVVNDNPGVLWSVVLSDLLVSVNVRHCVGKVLVMLSLYQYKMETG